MSSPHPPPPPPDDDTESDCGSDAASDADSGSDSGSDSGEEGIGVTEAQFRAFVLSKAYDVISEGRYKQHLVRGKATSESWAVSVHASVSAVQACVRRVQQSIRALEDEAAPASQLAAVCRHVASSLAPPCKIRAQPSVCCITGALVGGCIDLTHGHEAPPQAQGQQQQQQQQQQRQLSIEQENRLFTASLYRSASSPLASLLGDRAEWVPPLPPQDPTADGGTGTGADTATSSSNPTAWRRGPTEMLVHPKLGHFLLMLWYACKIEHVVRNYARAWVDGADDVDDIASLCREFEAQERLLRGMYAMFRHGCGHVLASLEAHRARRL